MAPPPILSEQGGFPTQRSVNGQLQRYPNPPAPLDRTAYRDMGKNGDIAQRPDEVQTAVRGHQGCPTTSDRAALHESCAASAAIGLMSRLAPDVYVWIAGA